MTSVPLSSAEPASSNAAGAGNANASIDPESLSAWLDGELPVARSDELVTIMLANVSAQQAWQRWALLGDALRSEETAVRHSQRLCDSICAAIDREVPILAPRALNAVLTPQRSRRLHWAGTSAAVAAAALVVLVVAVPQWRSGQGAAAPAALASAAKGQATTVASNRDPARTDRSDPSLDPYLLAHRQMAGQGIMPAAHVYLRYGDGSGQ